MLSLILKEMARHIITRHPFEGSSTNLQLVDNSLEVDNMFVQLEQQALNHVYMPSCLGSSDYVSEASILLSMISSDDISHLRAVLTLLYCTQSCHMNSDGQK